MKLEISKEELRNFLLHATDEQLAEMIEFIHPVDILEVIHEYKEDEDVIMKRLPSEILAEIVDEEEDEEKYGLLSHFSDTEQMVILEEMSSDEITDLVSVLDEAESEDVLSKMNVEDRQEVRELLSYDADTAGGLMATEFISLSQHMSVLQTLEYLQKAAQDAEMAYYLYVVDQSNVLTGVVSLREIVAHSFDTLIRDIANPNIISVPASTDQEEVARIFSKYSFLMMPVVDEHDHILGVITVDDVMDIIEEENTEDIHRLAQINEEEKVDGSLIESLKSRLPWLLINLLTAFLASSVVAVFSGTIEKVVALAAVNPIIAGMGGNAGTQSLTIVVRGIALGELTGDNARRVFFKEFGVGILSGVSIGLVVALICGVMQQNPIFGLVVGLAMLLNMAFATIAGYAVPVILKKINVDPALASSVFVTTVTDVLGFFFFLGLATLFLPYLI
ncbi:magnesium transporter [Holdemania filiformis]|uniref:magnesium transporter n=1 Tax=Holdemania filiformis TaxID=61171 RepID=UPI00210BE018|nr:magnesium transporter [Holdemania filiformis]MCQ4954793.1 magnesium transporter [Holdemania filiformis]